MLHQLADLFVRRVGGKRDGRLLAGFPRGILGVLRPQPLPRGDEAGERLRQFREQRLARRHRQVGARQQVLADRRQMAEALDHAVDREHAQCRRRNFPAAPGRPAPRRPRRWPRRASTAAWRAWRWRPAPPDARWRSDRPDRLPSAAASAPARGSRSPAGRQASACTTTRGAFCAEANTSASALRTSGDGSSSSMIIAPSAAARSSAERSEWR